MAKLAISGGPKTVTRTLGTAWPIFGAEEEKALLEVLHGGKWWRGAYAKAAESKVGQFEDAFAAFHNARFAVAVTNGTQAIECALKAAGIGAGDEVLVPAMTFVASATAIALVNAVPKFVDIDPATYNIDPAAMEVAIGPKTKAAVIVHNGGYPCDLDRVLAVGRKHGIRIIEDCAHAHGSQWQGSGVGHLGDFGTFSFQMGKTLTCGEGGLVMTDDPKLAELAYSYHHIGRIADRPFYEFHRLASNLRLTEFQGAILLAQLARLGEQTLAREANATYLAKGLAAIPGLEPIRRDPRVTRWGFYYWNLFFRPEAFDGITRDQFLKAAGAEGVPIGVGGHGAPLYRNPLFLNRAFGPNTCPISCPFYGQPVDYAKARCENAEKLHAESSLSLGHRLFLGSREDMDLILEAFAKVRNNLDELRDK